MGKQEKAAGDNRTPDKRIGEVAYADDAKEEMKPASEAEQQSSLEGPAAYSAHPDEKKPAHPEKKK